MTRKLLLFFAWSVFAYTGHAQFSISTLQKPNDVVVLGVENSIKYKHIEKSGFYKIFNLNRKCPPLYCFLSEGDSLTLFIDSTCNRIMYKSPNDDLIKLSEISSGYVNLQDIMYCMRADSYEQFRYWSDSIINNRRSLYYNLKAKYEKSVPDEFWKAEWLNIHLGIITAINYYLKQPEYLKFADSTLKWLSGQIYTLNSRQLRHNFSSFIDNYLLVRHNCTISDLEWYRSLLLEIVSEEVAEYIIAVNCEAYFQGATNLNDLKNKYLFVHNFIKSDEAIKMIDSFYSEMEFIIKKNQSKTLKEWLSNLSALNILADSLKNSSFLNFYLCIFNNDIEFLEPIIEWISSNSLAISNYRLAVVFQKRDTYEELQTKLAIDVIPIYLDDSDIFGELFFCNSAIYYVFNNGYLTNQNAPNPIQYFSKSIDKISR